MYISYDKLWKLLIDKNLSKTELITLTGISSRVMAKLSKNETVTTETVARICSVLGCDVGDIMECVSESEGSLYTAYKKLGRVTEKNELYKTVRFEISGKKYKVYESIKSAGKGTRIHCRENKTVYWEQLYICGGFSTPQSEEYVLVKPKREKDEITIVIIKGKPSIIIGLDEGIFTSARGMRRTESDVFVMSEAAFKLFAV